MAREKQSVADGTRANVTRYVSPANSCSRSRRDTTADPGNASRFRAVGALIDTRESLHRRMNGEEESRVPPPRFDTGESNSRCRDRRPSITVTSRRANRRRGSIGSALDAAAAGAVFTFTRFTRVANRVIATRVRRAVSSSARVGSIEDPAIGDTRRHVRRRFGTLSACPLAF